MFEGVEGYDYWIRKFSEAILTRHVYDYDSEIQTNWFARAHITRGISPPELFSIKSTNAPLNGWLYDTVKQVHKHCIDGVIDSEPQGVPSWITPNGIGWLRRDRWHRECGPAWITQNDEASFCLDAVQYSLDVWLSKTPLPEEQKVMLKLRWG